MIRIKELKDIDEKIIQDSINILDHEIKESILSHLSYNLKYEYLKKFILKENTYYYACFDDTKIIGFALLGNNPSEYFKNLKYKILIHLILKLKFKTILNISIAFLNIDTFHLDRKLRKIIDNHLNLTLIAIKQDYQSQGIGKLFFEVILKDFKKKNMNTITLEADNNRSISFYEKKLNFRIIGKKFRFFKYQKILMKDF